MSIYKVNVKKIEYGFVKVEAIGKENAETLAIILEEEKEIQWEKKKIEIENIEEIK